MACQSLDHRRADRLAQRRTAADCGAEWLWHHQWRPRYAKQKMEGVPLATPQPAPLSHTLWNDVSPVKTESDPRVMNHRDTAAFNRKDVTLKEAEKAAAKLGAIVWSVPSTGGEVKVTKTNPRLVHLHLYPARPPRKKAKPRSWWKARALLDWHAVFFARWNAGGDHLHTERVAVRQPGGGEYSPIWYRRRKWCEGDPEGPDGQITYLGSPGRDECPPGRRIDKWPFKHMRFRSVGQALYEVGIVHLNYWVTSGIEGPVSRLYNGRAEHRRTVYRGALAALKKKEVLTRKPITKVVEAVILYNATINDILHLSRYRNNSYASLELVKILCDGLMVLEEYYRCVGEWEETS